VFIRRNWKISLKEELLKRGYVEVITPHIGNLNLYKTSGHYPYYSDSQFDPIKVEDEEYLLKPMNCPHHHQIYSSKPRSYKICLFVLQNSERYIVTSNQVSLAVYHAFAVLPKTMLTFIALQEQLKDEIKNTVELTQLVFKTFNMPVTTRLSFRDDCEGKYAGDIEKWELAQKILKEVADEINLEYFIDWVKLLFMVQKLTS
jgi:threonyl-tRNA synthetase